MGPLKLFDNDEGELDDKIEIDQEFSKRYDYNKKREALQRYEELKKHGLAGSSDSDSDESSSEDEELMKPSKKKDSKFFDALIKLKKQDPVLGNKDAKLFDSDTESGVSSSNEENEEEKKKKPMYLKDVASKHLIEEGPEFGDEEKQNDNGDSKKKKEVKSYADEQEELRREFFEADAVRENDDEEDLFRVKSSGIKDAEEPDDELMEKMDEYFEKDDKLDSDTLFLKNYFRGRMWCDDSKGKDLKNIEFSEDEEEIDKQEDYERGYNFRFEENAGDAILGHSRKVEGSVRKKENARKSQRERKEERIALAEQERKEELKRLKNLKKKEINEKLEKIRKVAGIENEENIFLNEDDLEDEFDPEKHDMKMTEAFGDGYYNAEDANFGSDADDDVDGLTKPDFDEEDELLGLAKNWDEVEASGQGFLSARERILRSNVVDENIIEADNESEAKEGKRKRKRKASEVEKAVREELMEEYYKLDYEDTIGELKTRFKYKPVKAKRYGLTPKEILMMDDKELNQYVSLKKLAPYQENEWKVPRSKTLQFKQKSKLINGNERKMAYDKKEAVSSDASQPAQSNDTGTISRKAMRRRRQAEFKLSHSRLMAYGKIPSKTKSKSSR